MNTIIHQPDFMPWIGYFDKMKTSNLIIYLDDVQFSRTGWTHRDKIKVSNTHSWLTVPVEKKNNYYKSIKDIKIKDPNLLKLKHSDIIKNAYQKSRNFENIFPSLLEIYNKNHKFLIDLNIDFINLFCDYLDVKINTKFSSEFKINSSKSDRLIELLQINNAKDYLTGIPSKSYLDQILFERKNININWHILDEKNYKKKYKYFNKNLSTLYFIMNKND